MNKIILIGGAPTVGKSFIARKVAKEFDLPWISTDTIVDMMRKIVAKKDFPKLFPLDEEEVKAEKYLTTHTPEQIVDDQNAESEEAWKGVEAIIDTDYVWKDYLVEGVAVLPKLVKQIDTTKHLVNPIFLVDKDEARMRKVIFTRGLWDYADTYSDGVKEIEVEWAMLFNKYIEAEAKKYGYKVYEIGEREVFIKNLITEIRDWLKT